MHIDHPNAGAVLRNFAVVRQDFFQNLFRHTHTVVFNGDQDVLLFLFSTDDNPAVLILIHISNTIINGIFQNGLDHQLYDAVVFDLFLDPEFCFKSFFVPCQLDIHVASAVLQLVFDRDNGLSPGQADTKQFCQFRDHTDCSFIFLGFHHPGDGFQCVIQKMRIDLALQGIQFTFSPFILLSDDLIHQFFDLLIRLLYRMSQMTDLRGASNINIRLSSCFIGLNRSVQLPDRFGYLPGYQLVSLQKHDQQD